MPASAVLRRLCALVLLLVIGLFGAATTLAPGANAAQQRPINLRIGHAANVAIAHIGDPYRYGAAGPGSFDCSGLSMYSYGHSHMGLPRTAAEQYASVRHLIKKHMIRGDLVFFHDSSGHVFHVGIFLYWAPDGVAVIVHAPYPGQRVRRQRVWTSAWYAGTRRP